MPLRDLRLITPLLGLLACLLAGSAGAEARVYDSAAVFPYPNAFSSPDWNTFARPSLSTVHDFLDGVEEDEPFFLQLAPKLPHKPHDPNSTLRLRYARFDLASVELLDPHTETPVATLYPLDKHRNAERGRRALEPLATANGSDEATPGTASPSHAAEMAPLLRRLIAEYAATGLPPAYLPFHPDTVTQDDP